MKQLFSFINILILLLSLSSVQAQTLFPKKDFLGMWGYVDSSGKWVYEPVYDEASQFIEGIARVKVADKYGLISYNRAITELIYDELELSNNTLLLAKEEWSYGYLNRKGEVIIPFEYSFAKPFYQDSTKAEVYRDEFIVTYLIINTSAKIKFIPLDSMRIYPEPVPRPNVAPAPYSEGLALRADRNKNGYYGYIDINGEWVIEPQYNNAQSFRNGLAAVCINQKWGFIDKNNTVVAQLKYDEVEPFEEGFAKVRNDYKWGFIDKKGKEICSIKYDFVSDFQEKMALVCLNGKWGYINTNGNEIIPIKYKYAEPFKNGKARVSEDNKTFKFIPKPQ